jgi:hypothetical protein
MSLRCDCDCDCESNSTDSTWCTDEFKMIFTTRKRSGSVEARLNRVHTQFPTSVSSPNSDLFEPICQPMSCCCPDHVIPIPLPKRSIPTSGNRSKTFRRTFPSVAVTIDEEVSLNHDLLAMAKQRIALGRFHIAWENGRNLVCDNTAR